MNFNSHFRLLLQLSPIFVHFFLVIIFLANEIDCINFPDDKSLTPKVRLPRKSHRAAAIANFSTCCIKNDGKSLCHGDYTIKYDVLISQLCVCELISTERTNIFRNAQPSETIFSYNYTACKRWVLNCTSNHSIKESKCAFLIEHFLWSAFFSFLFFTWSNQFTI